MSSPKRKVVLSQPSRATLWIGNEDHRGNWVSIKHRATSEVMSVFTTAARLRPDGRGASPNRQRLGTLASKTTHPEFGRFSMRAFLRRVR
jgi:hypothetical protein